MDKFTFILETCYNEYREIVQGFIMRVGANILSTISMSIHSLHVRCTSSVHLRDRNMAKAGLSYIADWRT